MNGWFNPDSWLDLVSQVLLVVGGLSIAVVPSWLSVRKSLKEVSDSVNNRPTTMRDDLDGLRSDVTGMRDEMRGGFNALRADISEERRARRAGDDAIRDEIDKRSA